MKQVDRQIFDQSLRESVDADGTKPSVIMLVLPLPIYRSGAGLHIDAQAFNGLRHWLNNFDRMILCMAERELIEGTPGLVPLESDAFEGRYRIVCLPDCRRPLGFLRAMGSVVRQLDAAIDESTHRSFAIGGLFGDWAAVAALRAHRKGLASSVWTDRVESEVARFAALQSRGPRMLLRLTTAFAMKHYERIVIRRAALGLFHGADCHAAYAPYSASPHIVHNIHLSKSARISPAALAAKIQQRHGPLRIVYAGRAHAEKGVFDWIDTLGLLATRGIAFTATWYGDGPDLGAARAAVTAAGLDASVAFPGPLTDRDALMRNIRDADLFLFCHKTPESPRCLIEALISGTPIVGYDSAYPRDLIAKNQGGRLTPGRPQQLAEAVAALAADPSQLAALLEEAAADGYPFTDVDVFRHRADLIKFATAAATPRYSRDTSSRSVARRPRSVRLA